jgi:hypothetical protein
VLVWAVFIAMLVWPWKCMSVVLASHMLRSSSPTSGMHGMKFGCLHPTWHHALMLGLLVVSGVILLPSATTQGQW